MSPKKRSTFSITSMAQKVSASLRKALSKANRPVEQSENERQDKAQKIAKLRENRTSEEAKTETVKNAKKKAKKRADRTPNQVKMDSAETADDLLMNFFLSHSFHTMDCSSFDKSLQ